MKKKAKKRNPQDSTRRNVQAANKRIAKLETEMKLIVKALDNHSEMLRALTTAPATEGREG